MFSTMAMTTGTIIRAKRHATIQPTAGATTPMMPEKPPPINATKSNVNDVIIMINTSYKQLTGRCYHTLNNWFNLFS